MERQRNSNISQSLFSIIIYNEQLLSSWGSSKKLQVHEIFVLYLFWLVPKEFIWDDMTRARSKVIVKKSFGENCLFLQCTTWRFGLAQRSNFNKLKVYHRNLYIHNIIFTSFKCNLYISPVVIIALTDVFDRTVP